MNLLRNLAVVIFLLSPMSANAMPVVGEIAFGGSAVGEDWTTATQIDFLFVIVNGGTGNFGGVTPGTIVSVQDPFTFDPASSGSINPFWAFTSGGLDYSFALESWTINQRTPTFLDLSLHGTVSITGFDDTEFTWTLSLDEAGTALAAVTMTTALNPGNQPPVAVDDYIEIEMNSINSFDAAVFLANDHDPDGDPLSIVGTCCAVNGAGGINGPEQLLGFFPNEGFTGTASIDYQISDGVLFSNWATITFNVLPPLASDIVLSDTVINFVKTPVGETDTQLITVSNEGNAALDFSVTSTAAEFVPHIASAIIIPGEGPRNLSVTFTPTIEGVVTGDLVITSNDPDSPTLFVTLNGEGGPPNINVAIDAIEKFMREGLGLGGETKYLSFNGAGSSGPNRFEALISMIKAAGDLYAAGDLAGACGQLDSALRKMDGNPNPPDFVAGYDNPDIDGLASLYQQVADLKTLFGCP